MNKFIEIPADKKSILHRTLVCGIGINDADYQVQPYINNKKLTCPFYRAWCSMLRRCYSKKYKEINQTYKGCTVCDNWLMFSNFKKWMESQDWENKQLDKDILIPGNKIYSPNTCVFVTSQLNKLLTNRKSKRGKYPQGVSFDKEKNKFQAKYSENSKSKRLGQFDTVEEASIVYKQFKMQHIINIANEQTEIKIKEGLLKHAELLK